MGTLDDKTGEVFGFLTVEALDGVWNRKAQWRCRCACGRVRVVASNHLMDGAATHCGCRNRLPRIDLTDQHFGHWTVMRYVAAGRYRCRCACGTERTLHGRDLRNHETASCGCVPQPRRLHDLTGRKFGKLTVLQYAGKNRYRNAQWRCVCACGNTVTVAAGQLHKGTASCGCARAERIRARTPEEIQAAYLKASRTSNHCCRLPHWRTGSELVCRGSYEKLVVDFLNGCRVDYVWQIPVLLPDGKTYIADAYLPEQDLWVEIKGYARPAAMQKWALFHSIQPNSVVWDRPTLRSMGIKVR